MAHGNVARRPAEQVEKDQAAAYEAWFRSEVEKGLRQANDPNAVWHTQEEIESETERQCAEWQARIDRGES
jgi:DNA-damage-inducible protein J